MAQVKIKFISINYSIVLKQKKHIRKQIYKNAFYQLYCLCTKFQIFAYLQVKICILAKLGLCAYSHTQKVISQIEKFLTTTSSKICWEKK